MRSHPFPRRFERGIFDAHLIHEIEQGTRLSFQFIQREEEELNRVAEDEFKTNYQEEYKKACAEAEEVFSLSLWKFVFSVSEPEKFLPQLPYNERSQCNQGLAL